MSSVDTSNENLARRAGADPRVALVVDTDRAFVARITPMLTSLGLSVVVLSDGQAARDRVQKGGLALVVTELSLPKVDGFAVLATLRETASAKKTLVVAVSSLATLRTAASQRRAELGIAAVIAKNGPLEAAFRSLRRAMAGGPVVDESPPVTAPAIAREPAPDPRAEARRLSWIKDHALLDDEEVPPGDLNPILDSVARDLGVRTALVSFVLEEKQWFKAYTGKYGALADVREGPRSQSFCRHVVEGDAAATLIVPDAAVHPVFKDYALVKDGTVRSYVGVPLVTSGGLVIGTLCAIDDNPSRLDARQIERLVAHARHVAGRIELVAMQATHARRVATLETSLASLEGAQRQSASVAARLAALLDHIEQGVMVVIGDERRVVVANDALLKMLDVTRDQVLGRARHELVELLAARSVSEDATRAALTIPDVGPYVGTADVELRHPRGQRILRWSSKPVLLDDVPVQLSTFLDVTADRELLVAREREAHVDGLTSLLNRRGLDVGLAREVARRARAGVATPVAVVLFDIDHFKRVNDEFGHATGDVALQRVASVVQRTVRESDLACRWGGEELLAVLFDVDEKGAAQVAERVRASLATEDIGIGRPITLSAGVAPFVDGDLLSAVRAADARLYRAKAEGRDRVVAEGS